MLRRTIPLLEAARAASVRSAAAAAASMPPSGPGKVVPVTAASLTSREEAAKVPMGTMLGTAGSRILTSHLGTENMPMALARSSNRNKTLYQLLSTLPNDGVGFKVRQRRWEAKGLDVPRGANLHQHIANVKYLREQHRQAILAAKQVEQNTNANPADIAKPAQAPTLTPRPPNPLTQNASFCYWTVTKVDLKDSGKHGKAWGTLTWRGKQRSSKPERIRGSLKYFWNLAR